MAETQTPNYKWTKPDIGGDASTWGNVLNTTFDAIDSAATANQQAGVPIGSIQMFGGVTLPPNPNGTGTSNWLWCNGAVYLDSDVPLLASILKGGGSAGFPGSDASHTAVPLLSNGRGPVGYGGAWSMGLAGGEYDHKLLPAEMPVHLHGASQTPHTHGAYQDVHTHYVYQDVHAHTVASSPHSHNIVTYNHGHNITTNAHSHGFQIMQFRGGGGQVLGLGTVPGNVTYGNTDGVTVTGSADAVGNIGGYTDAQYANIGNTDNRQPGVYADNRQPALHVDTQTPGITVGNAGGDTVHNNMQPYTVVGFIIRYK